MIRCYLPAAGWTEGTAELDEDESKHLVAVMRAKAGDRIGLIDGEGGAGEAELVVPNKRHAVIRLLSTERVEPFRPRRILAQALVREQKMDSLIQKAVELGVHEIWPLQTDHAVAKIRPGEAARKAARWEAIALAACKQSGNPWKPVMAPVRRLEEALAVLPPGGACFGALQEGAVPLPEYFGRLREERCEQVTMFIGPEGDFSPAEVAALTAAGVQAVTFGPRVFRVETAAVFVLSSLQYAWLESGPGRMVIPRR
ncbi:MAG: 16S rRNA (uracil(1498)-N(3))-methyltransferase [Lentisphaerae bacterium]|nr:16S rRNA (uracil(1498)-N(3))-methyltransferase [Lentisphaerota bacterium]